MTYKRLHYLLFLVATLVSGTGAAASGPNYSWSLNHYQHTAFTHKDGAPQSARVLAETTDGYLWSSDVQGLMRFDGIRFQLFVAAPGEKLAGKQVYNLFAPTTGGLWVIFDSGETSFIEHGHITNRENKEWVPKFAHFYQDRNGDLIAQAFPIVTKLIHGKWQRQPDVEIPAAGIRDSCVDESFNIWAVTKDGHLLVLREGAKNFIDMHIDVNKAISVSAGPNHSIFVSFRSQIVKRYFDDGNMAEIGRAFPYYARHVVIDHRGLVWLGATNGVHFLGPLASLPEGDLPFPVDVGMDRSNGLTGSFASVFEDHKGNIWVGTDLGLDRFTPSAFSQLPLPSGLTMVSIAPGQAGDVWIGSENFPTRHLVQDEMLQTPVPSTLMTTYTAASGAVYGATAEDLWQFAPGTPHVMSKLPVDGVGAVKAIGQGSKGELMLSFRNLVPAVMSFEQGKWRKIDGFGRPTAIFTDQSGVLWAGIGENLVASYIDGSIKKFASKDGLSVGVIKSIAARDGLLWFGGDQRLQMFDGAKFRTLELAGAYELSNISGVVFDQEGNLWVHVPSGLIRIRRGDVHRAVANSTVPVPYRLFESTDGVPGVPAQTYTLPTLRLGTDGRLWITGQTAAAWLDPQTIPEITTLNAPIIEKVSDGQKDYELRGSGTSLSKDTRDLQFTYTTPELQFPERVRFQYRLRGFDDKWQDAGKERKASYPHLSGGDYVFEVRSAWNGDAWNGKPSSIAFSIALKYYETWWFRTLLTALTLLAIFGLVRFQMRIATYRERGRMQIRLNEREAVARDLHDTLLQSNQAIVLQLHALASSVADPSLKAKLDHLTQISQSVNVEGREKVEMLRSPGDDPENGIARVMALGRELSAEHGIAFKVAIKGIQRTLGALACAELVPMANELLINAFRHAKATEVSITFTFGRRRLEVIVCDDGVGIDKVVLAAGAPKGHWGLQGVKERAGRLAGSVTFKHIKPSGSRITICVPARRAYAPYKPTALKSIFQAMFT